MDTTPTPDDHEHAATRDPVDDVPTPRRRHDGVDAATIGLHQLTSWTPAKVDRTDATRVVVYLGECTCGHTLAVTPAGLVALGEAQLAVLDNPLP